MKGGKKAIKVSSTAIKNILSRLEKKRSKNGSLMATSRGQFTRFAREVREKEEVLENARRQLRQKEKDS